MNRDKGVGLGNLAIPHGTSEAPKRTVMLPRNSDQLLVLSENYDTPRFCVLVILLLTPEETSSSADGYEQSDQEYHYNTSDLRHGIFSFSDCDDVKKNAYLDNIHSKIRTNHYSTKKRFVKDMYS